MTLVRSLSLVVAVWWISTGLLVSAGVIALVSGGAVVWIAIFGAVQLAFSICGAVIASRMASHPIGWLFLVFGLLASLAIVLEEISVAATRPDDSIPTAALAGLVVSNVIYGPLLFGLVAALVLVFPSGSLPSPRWRPAAVAAGFGTALFSLVNVVSTGDLNALDPNQAVENPLAIRGTGEVVAGVLGGVSFMAMTGVLVAGVVSLARRYRHATGTLRQQLKWFGGAAILVVAGGVAQSFFWNSTVSWASAAILGLFAGTVVALPVATAIAILRYRLYDFDLIVRRTLVYAVLVVVLAAVYLLGVFVVGALVQSVVGRSDALAVTLSTLAVAALFQPLRRRIRGVIDRRFYRPRYDAGRALELFGGRLRDQIEIDALEGELLAVVGATVGPSHASIWLRN